MVAVEEKIAQDDNKTAKDIKQVTEINQAPGMHPKPMGNLKHQFQIKFFEPTERKCPNCGHVLYRHRAKSAKAKKDCCVICFNCNYPVEPSDKQKELRVLQSKMYVKDSHAFFANSALLSTPNVNDLSFTTYVAKTPNRVQIKQMAMQYEQYLIKKHKNDHLVINGPTGTGKTHLGVAIVRAILSDTKGIKTVKDSHGHISQRAIKVAAVNWSLLLGEFKSTFSDTSLKPKFNHRLEALQTADVILIDDLGSEAGIQGKDYAIDLATQIFEKRIDLATIITTNLTGRQIAAKYGSRIASRISTRLHIIKTDKLPDYRKEL